MKKFVSVLLVLVTLVSLFGVMATTASAASYKVSVTTGTYYTIKNLGSGKMLNVYGSRNANNVNVTVYQNDGTSGQKFKFVKSGSNYVIVPKCATSRAVNVYGNYAGNNTNVCIWSKSGHSTQSWVIEYNSKYSGFVIRSANNTNYVLTATGSSNSSNVCLKKYDASNKYQVWTCSGLKATAVSQTTTSSSISSPVVSRKITSHFQPYYRQDYKNKWAHVGVDYVSSSNNTGIAAFYQGKVTRVAYNGSAGNYIEIKHSYNGKTFYSYYFHLKTGSTLVKVGNTVATGQKIATMGTTGDSTGVHLHFQITSASVINSNGTIHTPANNASYRNWSIAKQSALTSFTSSRKIVFYNPELVLKYGLSVIA